MAGDDQDTVENLRGRIENVEQRLHRIELVLLAAAVIVVCLLIPPLRAVVGFVIFVAVILLALFTYMYAVVWTCQRLFGGKASGKQDGFVDDATAN